MARFELHGARTGNCLRVAIAFEEVSLPYEVKLVDLGTGEHRGSAYLALNPAGRVPTVVEHRDDGTRLVLSQSNAIMFALAERAPGRLLPVGDGIARARALERFFMVLTDVIAPSHAAFALRGKDEDARASLDDKAVTELSSMERFAGEARFLAGSEFTLADVAALTIAAAYESRLEWSRLPALRTWFDDVSARAAVSRGLQAFDGRSA